MRPGIYFLFATCVIYWLPSNARSSGNTLTTGYRSNSVAYSLGVPELPIVMLQRRIQRSRRQPQISRYALEGAKIKRFWKANKGGPLPAIDDILGGHTDGQLTDLGPSHKAMRYG